MDDGLKLEPRVPLNWNVLSFRAQRRGRRVKVTLDGSRRGLWATLEVGEHMRVSLGSHVHMLEPGQVWAACWEAPRVVVRKLDSAA